MTTTRTVASNTLVQILGKILTVGLSLALLAILGRLLGVEGLGQYTTVVTFMGMIAVLADFGFFFILVRELSLPDARPQEAVANVIGLRTVLAVLVYGLGLAIGWQLDYPAPVLAGLGIIAIGQFALTFQNTFIAVLQAKLQMGRAVIADVIGRGLVVGLAAWIAAGGGGLAEVFWAVTAGYLVTSLVAFFLTNALVPIRIAADLGYWRYLVAEALPLGINSVLQFVYFKVDTILLSLLKSSVEVGIYGVPFRILEVLIALPGFFINSIFPILTKLYGQEDPKWRIVFQQSFDLLTLLTFPMVVGGMLLAEPLVAIAGPEFVHVATLTLGGVAITPVLILQVLMVGVGLSYLSFIFNALILAAGKQRWLVAPNVGYAVFNIGLNLLLIPRLSYLAAAAITVATEALILTVSILLASRLITFPVRLQTIPKSLAASAVMAGLLWALPGANLWLEVPVAILVYGVLVYRLGAVDPETIRALLRRT
ncbi:flippase [Candidatus Berkelbacteria bacterium]|nr:flippase [Candidatus Berkelbacteria bacterium]